jgi:Protein of unknown function (DUF559)/Transcriptional regulator, AbiEi antitoxin
MSQILGSDGGEIRRWAALWGCMDVQNGPRSPNRVITQLAARQHGVVARRQLIAAGVGRESIALRLGAGLLHPLYRGVYAVGHPTLTTEGGWLAAVLACGPGAVLSHRAAAALWGLRPAWRHWREVSARRAVQRVPGVLIHRPRHLTDEDCTVHHGIPTTTPSRTLVDVADVVSADVLRKLLEQAELLRLDAAPRPIPGRRGAGRLTKALDALRPALLTRSELEDRMLALCREAGLPMPEVNVIVEGMEVDFCWRRQRVVVETDGWAFHGTRTAFALDRRRTTKLQLAGWTVVRFTYEDVVRYPAYVTATLRSMLSS